MSANRGIPLPARQVKRSQRIYRIALWALAAILSGCAYLTTYTRSVNLDGKSIAMDVKQRVVIGQKRFDPDAQNPKKEFTVICAEPSPDALTVLSATGGLSATNAKTGTAANATAALAESGASIGLRTQSIQLLRDAMYRLCEGYASGAIDTGEYVTMLRRFQSSMMGLIAIEQLTGPVVAQQALLNTSAASQAGAGAGDAAVTAAQASLKTATDDNMTAQANLDTARSNYDKAHQNVQENQKAVAAEKDPDKRKSLQDATPGLLDAQTSAANARKDAERRAQAAAQGVQDARAALAAAQSRASSSASGSGNFSALATSSEHLQENLGANVVSIVESINTAYERDDCLALMSSLIKNPYTIIELQKASPIATPTVAAGPTATPEQVDAVAVVRTALGTCSQILRNAEQQAEELQQKVQSVAPKNKVGS